MNESIDVSECIKCPNLVECRSQIVNGTGDVNADILFVGEAPGENEDKEGKPFVGRSGSILRETMESYNLSEENCRITNCVRCRPPDNRDPHKEERENCYEYLLTEIDVINPNIIVTLGNTPSSELIDTTISVTSDAGEVYSTELNGEKREVLVCVHPAATLYQPKLRNTFSNVIKTAAEYIER